MGYQNFFNYLLFLQIMNYLRQGCVMCPWLFNVSMDGVVREVNVRVLGKGLRC